nr:immunoglobulin light chain junction region [Macaca mulatta]
DYYCCSYRSGITWLF